METLQTEQLERENAHLKALLSVKAECLELAWKKYGEMYMLENEEVEKLKHENAVLLNTNRQLKVELEFSQRATGYWRDSYFLLKEGNE